MKRLFQQNAIFISLCLVLLTALGIALIDIPKADLHLLLCDHHTPARDIFFRYYTRVAEWLPYVICALLLLFSRVGDGVMASTAMLLSTLFTQVTKHIFVEPRPLTWFAENFPDIQLPLVEGVKMNYWYSFPSGHTTSFFTLAFVVSILATKSLSAQRSNSVAVCQCNGLSAIAVQLLLFIAASLGAYSRIYLCQHFAMDIFGGMLSGLLAGIISYAIFYRLEDKKWYNYRLFTKK